MQAYQRLGETDVPKFTVIVAQKRHHTKLFQAKGHENVPAGKEDTCSSSASVTLKFNFRIRTLLHKKRTFVRNRCGHQDCTPDQL